MLTGREDPRVARSKAKILASTLDQLGERGYEGLSIEGVAAAAGVGKTTIYRHWPSKAQLVVDAVGTLGSTDEIEPTGDLRDDLWAVMCAIVRLLGDARLKDMLPMLMDAANRDEDLGALHRSMLAERRARVAEMFRPAIDRGVLPADLDVDLAIDLLVGPLFYRALMVGGEVDQTYAKRVLDTLLPQVPELCAQRGASRRGRLAAPPSEKAAP